MKPTSILAILLTISVLLNILFWYKTEPELSECHVTSGFEVPFTITAERANGTANEYKLSLRDPDSVTGGVITRSDLDEMMCMKDCNAIGYTFARDSSGEISGDRSGSFVILNALNVEYERDSERIISVKSLGGSYYVTRHWCPPTCFSL